MSDCEKREEQLRSGYLWKSGRRFAEDYAEYGMPLPFEKVYYLPGLRIFIKAEKYVTDQDTQPMTRAE